MYGCDKGLLNNQSFIEESLYEAAIAAKATVVQQFYHQFSPHGISGTIVIAESHLNIHTWPEYGFAAIDVFTCGEDLRPDLAMDVMKTRLQAQHTTMEHKLRGIDIGDWI